MNYVYVGRINIKEWYKMQSILTFVQNSYAMQMGVLLWYFRSYGIACMFYYTSKSLLKIAAFPAQVNSAYLYLTQGALTKYLVSQGDNPGQQLYHAGAEQLGQLGLPGCDEALSGMGGASLTNEVPGVM